LANVETLGPSDEEIHVMVMRCLHRKHMIVSVSILSFFVFVVASEEDFRMHERIFASNKAKKQVAYDDNHAPETS
jgi:hypothetical protein